MLFGKWFQEGLILFHGTILEQNDSVANDKQENTVFFDDELEGILFSNPESLTYRRRFPLSQVLIGLEAFA